MKYVITALVAMTLVACASGPVFNEGADHEEGADIPCQTPGQPRAQLGWHACRRGPVACCPDGYSCSADDFVPRADGACRWWAPTATSQY